MIIVGRFHEGEEYPFFYLMQSAAPNQMSEF
jgi:hypothetical protein